MTLRSLRTEHGWTLTEVSRRTGFSVQTLSKVENDRVSLSYDKLIQLSDGLGVDISELFAQRAGTREPGADVGRRSINRLGEGERVSTDNYDYVYLSTDVLRKKIVPFLGEVHTGTIEEFGDLVTHSGEEFVYVLEGELEVHTSVYAPFVLKAGESTYLDSTMGHAYIAHGGAPCHVLAVCSASEVPLSQSTTRQSTKTRAAAHPTKRKRRAGTKGTR